ncbi:MAG: hypothetical protein ACWA5U_00335 [bacterium]
MKSPLLALASVSLGACASTAPILSPSPSQHTPPTAPTYTPAPPPQAATAQPVDIDPRVSHALQQQTFVPVIIELRPFTNLPNQPAPSPTTKAVQIQQIQTRVLAKLSPNEFTLGRRYSTIFAMSGSMSAAGLAVLKTHPNVDKITLNGMNSPQ